MPAHNTTLIHHLSDLHLGPLHYKPESKLPFLKSDEPASSRVDNYLRYLHEQKRKPDLVAISGDLTSYAASDEFDQVSRFLNELCSEMQAYHGDDIRRVIVVPGNHDMDWSQQTDEDRSSRFYRLVTKFQKSLVTPTPYETALPFEYYDDLNLLVYAFDSCSVGGVNDPELVSLKQQLTQLQATYKKLVSATDEYAFADALRHLDDLTRQDPGYIRPVDLEAISTNLAKFGEVHGRPLDLVLKIAVVHHNPTNLPSEDIERYDSIINGAQLKSRLMECGFDMVLHGHRHYPHCSYEEYIPNQRMHIRYPRAPGAGASMNLPYMQGLYVLSGGTVGSASEGAWFNIEIEDARTAHLSHPPSSLVSIRNAVTRNAGGSYSLPHEANFQFTIDKPIYASLRFLQERFTRDFNSVGEREFARVVLGNLWLPIVNLQAQVDDVSYSDEWSDAFNDDMLEYSQIFEFEVMGPTSWLNPKVLENIGRQFERRGEQLKNGEPLQFSQPVHDAIVRTGWVHSGHSREIKVRDNLDDTHCEIVRIFLWPKEECLRHADILRMLKFYHDLFAVPVFVLEPTDIEEQFRYDEFILGVNRKNKVRQCFRFFKEAGGKTRYVKRAEAQMLRQRFLETLAHKNLTTLNELVQ